MKKMKKIPKQRQVTDRLNGCLIHSFHSLVSDNMRRIHEANRHCLIAGCIDEWRRTMEYHSIPILKHTYEKHDMAHNDGREWNGIRL